VPTSEMARHITPEPSTRSRRGTRLKDLAPHRP
jgi:hypothetical protein